MFARIPASVCLSLGALVALGCSGTGSGSSSGSGCSGSASVVTCDIDTTATVCGDQITINCLGGATPEAKAQCQKAIKQGDQVIYCCASAAIQSVDAGLGGGGAGGAGGQGGGGTNT